MGLWALVPVLLAIALVIGLGRGCRKTVPVLPPPRQYVAIDALLPLHPAWSQVARLDQIAARLAQSPQTVTMSSSFSAQHAAQDEMPAPFAPAPVRTASMAAERQRLAAEDARNYITEFGEMLNLRSQAQLRAMESLEAKRVAGEFARTRAELEQNQQNQDALAVRPIDRQVYKLQFKQFALQKQAAIYTDQPRLDAQAQLRAVNDQIKALNAERADKLESSRRALAQQLADTRARLAQESAQRIANQRDALARNAREQLVREREQFEQQTDTLASLPPIALPKESDSTAPDFSLAFAPTPQPLPGQREADRRAVAQLQAKWATQRANLIAMIRRDTEQAVAQIGRQENLNLVTTGKPFRPDATPTLRNPLLQQWKQR